MDMYRIKEKLTNGFYDHLNIEPFFYNKMLEEIEYFHKNHNYYPAITSMGFSSKTDIVDFFNVTTTFSDPIFAQTQIQSMSYMHPDTFQIPNDMNFYMFCINLNTFHYIFSEISDNHKNFISEHLNLI